MQRTLSWWACLLLLACGGKAAVGEPCNQSGDTNACVNGSVCTNETSGNTCRKQCVAQTDCSSGESCNGISGSNLKSCQPDTGKK